MSVTHSAAARNAAANAVTALLNGGTLEILDGATVLAVLGLSATAFADAVDGVATANSITQDSSADAGGVADAWRAKDSGGTVVMSGAARASADTDNGEQLVLDNTNIAAGQQVSISSWTYEALQQ